MLRNAKVMNSSVINPVKASRPMAAGSIGNSLTMCSLVVTTSVITVTPITVFDDYPTYRATWKPHAADAGASVRFGAG